MPIDLVTTISVRWVRFDLLAMASTKQIHRAILRIFPNTEKPIGFRKNPQTTQNSLVKNFKIGTYICKTTKHAYIYRYPLTHLHP